MRIYSGEKLKELRKQAGLTQAKAAELARTPMRTWASWEQDPDTSSCRVPPGMAFTFLEMYIFMKNKGIEYEPEE